MRLSRADLAALAIVLGSAVTGIVVWNHGTVDLGMTLRVADAAELGLEGSISGPVVVVNDVTPGGNADRNGFTPGMRILDITTTDGSDVERGEPLGAELDRSVSMQPSAWPNVFGSVGEELHTFDETFRPPIEPVESTRIARIAAGEVYVEVRDAWTEIWAAMDRGLLEYELSQSIWVAAIGLLLAAIAWRLLAHGLAGPFGKEHAIPVAAAIAVPALMLPAVQVGTPVGIAGGYLVPAAVALVLGLSLARHHPEAQWAQTAMAASLVAAALVAMLVVRDLTAPMLGGSNVGTILLLVAAIGAAPAAVASASPGRSTRERASLLSLGFVPVAAAAVVEPGSLNPAILPIIVVVILIGWYSLPFERITAFVGGGLSGVRSITPASSVATSAAAVSTAPSAPASVAPATPADTVAPTGLRNLLTLGLFAFVALYGLVRFDGALVVLGVLMAGAVGLAMRAELLGSRWTDAAIPLAACVGLPVVLAGSPARLSDPGSPWFTFALLLASLGLADVIAAQHSDPLWRRRLVLGPIGLAVALLVLWVVAGYEMESWVFLAAGFAPLVPGLPVAFAADHDAPRAVSARLETMAVALTPAIAALVLTPLGSIPLAAWFIAIIVWRRYALAPLLGLAQRTQLQRDLAVAAAETERARLAADLHDDALQQLTMLVRTLDEGGHSAEADEAREIATKLRSVVGDLRLPILDDLGAGAALEWLVERVEPLAGGPVKLERSDETRRPPANVELAVFRVAQEALTNAIKHGKPPIAVHYDVRADGRVTLAIDDAGAGIGPEAAEEAPRAGHFGLANMQQRAEQIGAMLDVRRWPAGGTRVALEWRPQGS